MPLPSDDSDDDREVNRKVRQVRQAASKAVSKQREMLLGGGGSEDEEREEEEQASVDRKWTIRPLGTPSRAYSVYANLCELLFFFNDFLRPDIFNKGSVTPWASSKLLQESCQTLRCQFLHITTNLILDCEF